MTVMRSAGISDQTEWQRHESQCFTGRLSMYVVTLNVPPVRASSLYGSFVPVTPLPTATGQFLETMLCGGRVSVTVNLVGKPD
jgi:hypothetical protein